uniref:Uncharacterized protein n=1 Tax=Anguilla anguilla TaxID=7936 RepID=A0A0E9PMQ8_ANGAN
MQTEPTTAAEVCFLHFTDKNNANNLPKIAWVTVTVINSFR